MFVVYYYFKKRSWNNIMMWIIEFLHVLIGILWIGLLYFFNLVQVQSMPKMTEEGAAKPYTQIILPRALFFFRHSALWTVITGIVYYVMGRGVVEGIPSGEIMIGMLLGIIMAANVWFIIWPCLLYTSPSPRDATLSRMPSSA